MGMSQLLGFIVAGLAVQVAAFAAWAVVRHGRLQRQRQEGMGAWLGLRDFRVDRCDTEDELGSIRSFYLVPADGRPLPAFAPGQYLTFQLNVEDAATGRPRPVVRCYSLSDRPGVGHYRVTIKRVEPPGVSSGYFHDRVKVGDVLAVKAPAGHFRLDEAATGPIVLIAGGIGITPMLSMLGHSLEVSPRREVWLFYGVRNGSEQVMTAPLAALARAHGNFHLHVCYSRPRPGETAGADYQHAGHVDIELLGRELGGSGFAFYLCGPRAMLESLVPALRDWGVPETDIHYEAFGPASVARPGTAPSVASTPLAVTFARSERTLVWEGGETSLLELAEKHGLRIESGCRAGGCGTCRTRVESGEVGYDHPPEFDAEPGTCLVCVAVPRSDLVLDA